MSSNLCPKPTFLTISSLQIYLMAIHILSQLMSVFLILFKRYFSTLAMNLGPNLTFSRLMVQEFLVILKCMQYSSLSLPALTLISQLPLESSKLNCEYSVLGTYLLSSFFQSGAADFLDCFFSVLFLKFYKIKSLFL